MQATRRPPSRYCCLFCCCSFASNCIRKVLESTALSAAPVLVVNQAPVVFIVSYILHVHTSSAFPRTMKPLQVLQWRAEAVIMAAASVELNMSLNPTWENLCHENICEAFRIPLGLACSSQDWLLLLVAVRQIPSILPCPCCISWIFVQPFFGLSQACHGRSHRKSTRLAVQALEHETS